MIFSPFRVVKVVTMMQFGPSSTGIEASQSTLAAASEVVAASWASASSRSGMDLVNPVFRRDI